MQNTGNVSILGVFTIYFFTAIFGYPRKHLQERVCARAQRTPTQSFCRPTVRWILWTRWSPWLCFPTDWKCPAAAAVSRETVSLAASRLDGPVSAASGEAAGDPRPKHPRTSSASLVRRLTRRSKFPVPQHFRSEAFWDVPLNIKAHYWSQHMIMRQPSSEPMCLLLPGQPPLPV